MVRGFRTLAFRVVASWRWAEHDSDLLEQLESHVQLHTDENIRAGMPAAAARRDALLNPGGLQQTAEQCRDVRFIRALRHG